MAGEKTIHVPMDGSWEQREIQVCHTCKVHCSSGGLIMIMDLGMFDGIANCPPSNVLSSDFRTCERRLYCSLRITSGLYCHLQGRLVPCVSVDGAA